MSSGTGALRSRVLIVDDAESVRFAIQECLRLSGYAVATSASGEEALELLRSERFDLLLTDQSMPGLTGLELTEVVSRMHPDMPIVLLTGHTDVEMARDSMLRGASDFVTKPVNVQELPILIERNLTRRRLEVARLKERESAVLFAAIKALASAVDAKDPYTARHSMRVTRLALELGRAIELSGDEMYLLIFAAWMHDVGKIGVPDALLLKPGALEPAELAIMRVHAVKGGDRGGHRGVEPGGHRHPAPSRARGWARVPGRVEGECHPGVLPHHRHRGCLRGHDGRPQLPAEPGTGGGADRIGGRRRSAIRRHAGPGLPEGRGGATRPLVAILPAGQE
jgi:FixJ family two-component response regulator